MKIIGVTGGIGSGKSSVSAILNNLGAEVIDADILSHQVVEAGKPAYKLIVKEFGPEVLNDDCTLNRKRLAEIVFHQPKLRNKLEAIVHAEVIKGILDKINELKGQNYEGLVVLDVPIPVGHGFLDIVDTIWVVTADYETRINRIMKRSGLSLDDAKQRIQSQMTQDEYMLLGDEIIENENSLENLREKVMSLVQNIADAKS